MGLDGLLPRDSSLLLYPLSMLHRAERTPVKRWWGFLALFR